MKTTFRNIFTLLCTIPILGLYQTARASDDNPASALGSPLAGLALPHGGTARHEGSWDRRGGNGDARTVKPGETLTLLDYKGAGIIHRFWVTIAPRSEMSIHRQAILRMYWDDEPTPSVEVPIGDFFGVGFGEQVDYISLPLNETSGGYNCYWPMPFHKSARWTVTNLSTKNLDNLYFNIDFTGFKSIKKDLRHFHAQWRRENPTTRGKNYTILEASGKGHFVGTALFMQNLHGKDFGFLEGDEMIYFNGEKTPTVNGTGTEDYFSSGWYFDRGLYSAPYHGVTVLDGQKGRVSAYRWHIEDAMPFEKSIKVSIEHGSSNDHEADYSSVAYFYQSEPHASFPPFPADPAMLLPYIPPPPFRIMGAIEAESLIPNAVVNGGLIETQLMTGFKGDWSDETQLLWKGQKEGDTLTLKVPAPADGEYEVTAYLTKAPDYGIVQIAFGDQVSEKIDLYGIAIAPSGPIALGKWKLSKGGNEFVITVKWKNPVSAGTVVGIDAFIFKPTVK